MAQIKNVADDSNRPLITILQQDGSRSKRWYRRILGLLFAAALWFAISRFAEIEAVARTLERGKWQWLLVAVAFQCLCYWLSALNYRRAFELVGISKRTRELLPILLASLAVGEVAPMGWAAGSAVVIRYAIAGGNPPERATAGTLLAQATDLFAFSLMFATGVVFLFFQHDLQVFEIAGASTLLLMNAALDGFILLGLLKPALMLRLLKAFPRTTALATRLALHLDAMAASVRAQPRCLAAALCAALGAHASNICSLWLVFHAFAQPVGPGALVAGYGIGILSWMVSPVPSGFGVVEGMIALVFTSLGVPAGSAAVITIAYRGLSFWLPFLAGLSCLRLYHRALS